MNVTIDLSEQTAAALESQARAAHMPADHYLARIVEQALHGQHGHGTLKPRKSACGLLAQYGPGPTEEEIDENRWEMFRDFGGSTP